MIMLSVVARLFILVLMLCPSATLPAMAQGNQLCVDEFCIGQSIEDAKFDGVDWLKPRDAVDEQCRGIGCSPDVAFKGYPPEIRQRLAQAIQIIYGTPPYSLLSKRTVQALRSYSYECNPSPRGIFGERRFMGIFRSAPSQYLTVVGLRLINGELRVYRVAREFPFKNQYEFTSMAKQLYQIYNQRILFYDYLSSNAYSDVIQQSKDGWFARSSMFNPTDMADNKAELVLIDPSTRPLLEPTSMPDSGEIKPLPVRLPDQCAGSVPLR